MRYADGLCVLPSYTEYETLHYLSEKKLLKPNTWIVNGQTGDFISGGHIPLQLYRRQQPLFDEFLDYIISKHYSLWLNLKTPENITLIKEKIKQVLPFVDNALADREHSFSQYETWEWQERQSKMVVNHQRVYEYLGFRWSLPLWDSDFMDFWEKVPFSLKLKQKLYISYLKTYNYAKVFSRLRDEPQVWSLKYRWIVPVARSIGLIFGRKAKEAYYQRMYYYGAYHNQFSLLGRERYLKQYENIRNSFSLLVEDWLLENGIIKSKEQ